MGKEDILDVVEAINPEDIVDCDSCESKYIYKNIHVISKDNLLDSLISKDKFQEGVDSVSFLCGCISALTSFGITPDKAMDYICDKEATEIGMRHNIEIANIQKEASVESAKYNIISKADSY